MSEHYDVLVVGGGPAGAATAIQIAEAGRSVALLEREAGPHHKVCGEFLSREAIVYLSALGIDLGALGAHPIDRVRFEAGGRVAAARLPFRAQSLSRSALDAALLARAQAAGAYVRMGAKVQGLERTSAGLWHAQLADGETVAASAAFLATGKHDLRGWARPADAQTDFVGFKLHWRLTPAETRALGAHVELALFRGGYAGLELVENDVANLCLVVRKDRLTRVGNRWDGLLDALCADAPLLRRRLAGAQPCWERPLAVSGIPYGYVRREAAGPWRLGDQAAVIPSFSGDGMSIALHSARLAAGAYLAGEDVDLFQRRLAADVARPVRLAAAIARISTHPAGQAIAGHGLGILPRAMAAIASATRIPAAALARAGAAGN